MRYETRTKLSPREVLERGRKFFGEELGLTQNPDETGISSWQGGGGMISITFPNEPDQRETTVELLTTEWDSKVRDFMRRIGGHA